jgi:cytochrome b subunit of formate dehydrogenase
VILKIVYWLAVVAISLALVIGLILFLESRDQSSVDGAILLAPLLSP